MSNTYTVGEKGPEVFIPTEAGTPQRTFPVIEIFGPTIQGEGPAAGLRVAFVRFGGCDYRCAWCDTPDAVLSERVREQQKRLTADEIVFNIPAGVSTIILSGGNPGLLDLTPLMEILVRRGFRTMVETQGSFWKTWMDSLAQIVVSPKPPSAGYTYDTARRDSLAHFLRMATVAWVPTALKIPCLNETDLAFASLVANDHPDIPLYLSVVTYSGGLDGTFVNPVTGNYDTRDDLLGRYKEIVELSHTFPELRDAKIIPQLHYLLWGHERGR